MCFQAAYSSPIFSCSSVFLSNVLVFGMISLCFGFGFCNLAVHAINTLCLSIQINGFLLAFLFRALLLQPSIFSTVFMVSVQFCFVLFVFFVCVCDFSVHSASAHVCSVLPCCYFLFTLWSLPTCVSVSASPCALTIHTWSAVCPMIYVTLHLLSFFFGIFSWFLRSHNSYPFHFPDFLQFFYFFFYFS